MTTELENPEQIRSLVDGATGLIDRRIYADQEIFDLEMEKIYARAWLFMCHDSMIPNPGDFFQTYMGEDRVIVVRDKQGQAQVLLNTCRHRGNAVCRAEEGHATSFMCTYHGWTYDLQGKLVGVPGFKDYYHEDLNRDEWGLVAAKVQSYKGFIFATLDQEAPSLEEFLGDVGKMSIDLLAIRGTLRAAPGVEKYTIGCNWKFAADNVWDFYHAPITHASAGMSRQPQLLPSRSRCRASGRRGRSRRSTLRSWASTATRSTVPPTTSRAPGRGRSSTTSGGSGRRRSSSWDRSESGPWATSTSSPTCGSSRTSG